MGTMPSPTVEAVREALSKVNDPEIKRPITDLGMVDDIVIEGTSITARILLTVSGCPMKERLTTDVTAATCHGSSGLRIMPTIIPVSTPPLGKLHPPSMYRRSSASTTAAARIAAARPRATRPGPRPNAANSARRVKARRSWPFDLLKKRPRSIRHGRGVFFAASLMAHHPGRKSVHLACFRASTTAE